MKRMAFVIAAALAVSPVIGGVATAAPSYQPGDERKVTVTYAGSADRSNCKVVSRVDRGIEKVKNTSTKTVTNKDGKKEKVKTVTYSYVDRGIKIHKVCGY